MIAELTDEDSGGMFASTKDPDAVGIFATRRVPFEDNVVGVRFLAHLAHAVPAADAKKYDPLLGSGRAAIEARMKFPRSLAFFAVVPVALVVLAQGCSSGSTGGACAVIVDDAGPADQGRCASGPKQGKSCCVSSTASCASTLPLCQSICCTTTSDGGDGPLLTDDEGGTTDATFFEASTFDGAHPDGATSSCPGNTKQTAPLLNATCQAALEKVCCAELKACFNIAAGASSDCNAYAACISSCASKADPTTCQTDCDSMTTTSIRSAYDTLVTCATNSTGTACQ